MIIRLEGRNFDPDFRERLREAGRGYPVLRILNATDDEGSVGSDDELREARRHVETEGQRFRRRVMTRLFNSPSSGAVRRPE